MEYTIEDFRCAIEYAQERGGDLSLMLLFIASRVLNDLD
jgi:hypothetical protein